MSATTLRDLLDRWHAERSDPERLRRLDPLPLAREALALGCPTLACEMLRVCGVEEAGGPQARYLAALAHARVGACARAMAMAVSLLDDPAAAALRSDALALAGRIAKDRWSRLPPGAEREHAARQSVDCYRRAWESTGDFFPGVNAATMRLLAGDAAGARELAAAVRTAAESAAGVEPHWRAATLGECSLLLGATGEAETHYRAAAAAAGRQVGDIASMRRQLRLLGRAIEVPPSLLDILAIPRIVVFSGHMVDAADRSEPRLPAAIEPRLAARIAERLEAAGAGYGYCSAACGADLLFIEAMLARGGEVHVTLPFAREDFVAVSVAFAGSEWTARFERALAAATSVGYGVQERFLGDESLYGYAGALIQGAALMRARELETEPMMLAVLDAAAERRDGGTRDLVDNWRRLSLPLDLIDPATLRDDLPRSSAAAPAPAPAVELRSTPLRRQVRTMLFADMVGFSRLQEEDTPSFLVHFLGAIAEMLQECGHPPTFVNTWGDGLFMVFDEVEAGVEFALRLRDAVQRTDWTARGLPAGTSVRMGMHTGPVFEALDPLIGRPNYFGSHVVRAARIEPVAVPGAVYVSAELAFALAASGAPGFATDYLGVLPLAKGYGSGPLYRLRRSDAAE